MNNNTVTLYEHSQYIAYPQSRFTELEKHLIEVWKTRKEQENENTEEEGNNNKRNFQPFLSFHHSGKIQAQNWVGFIQDGDHLIEIYPKIFENSELSKEDMLKHIFFWMSKSSNTKIPFTKAGLNTSHIDSFPEFIIHLMANTIHKVLEEKPLSLYQEVEEALQMPKGRINFQRYINNSLVNGNWHKIECDYEPFVFDNAVNRIIKYTIRLLEKQTKLDKTKNLLRDALFILDDVEDWRASMQDVQKVKLNGFFEEYVEVLELCGMIIEQQIYNPESAETTRWTMLFPMEKLFEDFIGEFIKENFNKDWKVELQKSDKYIVEIPQKAFQMQNDIYLTHQRSKDEIIIDTKYKTRKEDDKNSNKKGVAQSDLYQMITYAAKRNCNNVILMYPCEIQNQSNENTLQINCFGSTHKINIHILEVPFWTSRGLKTNELEKILKETISNRIDNIATKNKRETEQIN